MPTDNFGSVVLTLAIGDFSMLNKNSVFVLDCNKTPCDPIHPAAARKLLFAKKAAILNRYPFTIILKEKASAKKQYRIKIDPGARFSGLALLSDANIVWCAEARTSWISDFRSFN